LPEQPYTKETTIRGTLTGAPIYLQVSFAEMKRIQEQQVKTLKWRGVSGFKDGQMYEIGVIEGAGVDKWMMGTLEEILEARKANSMPDFQTEAIPFVVKETKVFKVKRPDLDGHLNWP